MSEPLVSFIIPTYNAEQRLAYCLESICNQTYQNLEIILLNDGSKDHTPTICQRFADKDSRIVLVNKPNTGCCDSRNQGLSLAHGKYIQFSDSDDWLEPHHTERMVAAAEVNQADLVITAYEMVVPLEESLAGGTPVELRKYQFLPEGIYDAKGYTDAFLEEPGSFYYGVLWNKLYRRDIIEQNHIRFTSEIHNEDAYFNILYLPYIRKAVSLPDTGYYYLQNPASFCHSISFQRYLYAHWRSFCCCMKSYHKMKRLHSTFFRICRSLRKECESVVPSGHPQNTMKLPYSPIEE